ncbi:GNAT family N-acetyltransferase [Rhodanobacter glycinis]|uniref:Acetyltransferase (GNAT) domain-containing protein n=1 Tax=Rhodanobacter glycinis TaxID=582702 RepID=A0A1I4FU91_9GAMM|nr:GNAT family N-acetyltransferase [Rhodanobacter glycinis]SFL21113.1 Acetyltransferase (GNAT) domain-containing protein [Rhodanobacter glycinis]
MPPLELSLRLGQSDDARAIGVLVRRVARRWILPDQPHDAGVAMLERMSAKVVRERIAIGCRFHLAWLGGTLVGVAAMRDDSHLIQLFVGTRYQGRGIARRLWLRAMRDAVRRASTRCFTLNASRCAVPVYRRFGFVATGPERLSPNGVLSTPMQLLLDASTVAGF